MEKVNVAYEKTGFFSELIKAYLRGDEKLQAYYNYPFSIEAFEQTITKRQSFPTETRNILSAEILHQYENIKLDSEFVTQINSFNNRETFCVVTAHQLNIFTGPLYVLLKICNTIHVCQKLQEQYPDKHFVPVYMLGSEDHDFEEIASTTLFNQTISWKEQQSGPMGRYATATLLPLMEEVKAVLGNLPYADAWMDMLYKAYALDNLADATRYIIHQLFGSYGLVCVNGDSAALKAIFAPVIEQELQQGYSFPLLQATSEGLDGMGFHAQLSGREINLFYTAHNIRERIVKTASGDFEVLNTDLRFSSAEILLTLNKHPEYFSPNAVLRPIYQQTILPALAYIGGGGELAYWLQLKCVFEHTGTFFPLLILRTSTMLINSSQQSRMQKTGILPEDIFTETEQIKKQYLDSQEDISPIFNTIRQELEEVVAKLQEQAGEADVSLSAWAGAEGQKIQGIREGIERRVIKAYKAKHEQALQHIEKLKEQLFPNGNLQERVQNGGQWYALYGKDFIEELLELDPFQKSFTILLEEGKK